MKIRITTSVHYQLFSVVYANCGITFDNIYLISFFEMESGAHFIIGLDKENKRKTSLNVYNGVKGDLFEDLDVWFQIK